MVGMVAKFNEISMNSTKIFIGVFICNPFNSQRYHFSAIVNGNNSEKTQKRFSY